MGFIGLINLTWLIVSIAFICSICSACPIGASCVAKAAWRALRVACERARDTAFAHMASWLESAVVVFLA